MIPHSFKILFVVVVLLIMIAMVFIVDSVYGQDLPDNPVCTYDLFNTWANVRYGAGLDFNVIDTLSPESCYESFALAERPDLKPYDIWVQVKGDEGRVGWVWADLVVFQHVPYWMLPPSLERRLYRIERLERLHVVINP